MTLLLFTPCYMLFIIEIVCGHFEQKQVVHCPCHIVQSIFFMLLFIFVSMWSFRVEANKCIFIFCLFVYICLAIGDPILKKGHVVVHFCNSVWSFRVEANKCRLIYCLFVYLYLYCCQILTQLSRRGSGWNFINRFNPATLLCLSQSRNYISIYICCDLFVFYDIRLVVVVDLLILKNGFKRGMKT